ncbi:MAG TPA: alpha-amylase family glycosyl hydrolase [Vicinamibacterales bacterium]|nr:alpha-amylase family glycosyl hydrolase [Vicinamibacterales bacterium]
MRNHPHLYEISAWPWLERLSRQGSKRLTLGDVPGATWGAIAKSGMDCVYLMGVWKRSAVGRVMGRTDDALIREYDRVLPGWGMPDVPGSPYCIQAYEPDPRMGGWKGLDKARRELADRGVSLVLDFVPNHTGFDHDWIRTNPEYYVQGTLDNYRAEPILYHPIESADGGQVTFIACGRDPFFPPWRDVAQLNYFNPGTRDAMIGVLKTISEHCDGVRCDMAMLVLNDVFAQTWAQRVDLLWAMPVTEFWPDATARAPMTYLAEVYWDREFQLQQQGFNYTYDKRLLDRLHHGNPYEARAHLQADPAYAAKLARFLENHDEARSATEFGSRIRAATALTFTLPGLRFFFDGQFTGAAVRPPVQLGRWPDDPDRPDIRDLYARLLKAIDKPLFHDGKWTLLTVRGAGDATNADLIAYSWRKGKDLAVVVGNITHHDAQGLVDLGELPAGQNFDLKDQLSDQTFRWARADLGNGLYVRLGSGDAHLFLIKAAT